MFDENKQMRCLKVVARGNANGAKYPRNIASHTGFPKNVSLENITRLGEVGKCPNNSQN